jgi:two-component system, chemotaxis family, chemotaxis protein CheY
MENVNKITLIDDDPISHLISTRMIKLFSSLEVENFTDPREALSKLFWRATHEVSSFPNYILLDIDMPYMDGWQFLAEFEKLPEDVIKNVSIIILSSSIHFNDIEKAKQYKYVTNFLSKPLTEDKVRMLA